MKESLIIGGGAWGTAIANLVAENSNKKTFIWTLEENVKRDINRSLVNKSFLPKIKLEVAVDDDISSKVTEAIIKSAATGKIGDGKIFITSLEHVARIRTGETGSDAL